MMVTSKIIITENNYNKIILGRTPLHVSASVGDT